MAKPLVERAPKFDIGEVNFSDVSPHMNTYNETDEEGRYLHWNQLKWRVPTAEAKAIWATIKFKRALQMKTLNLVDDKGSPFVYSTPHSMEAKLHSVIQIAGGSVATVAGHVASDQVQKKFLVSSLIMEEAITSAQLEGASTTRAVAKKMLEEGREAEDEDERMIVNNFLLLKQAERMSSQPLTIDLILEFHRIATENTTENNVIPGEFREDNDIHVVDSRGDIAHQPPCFTEIKDRLQAFCDFANANHDGKKGGDFIPPVIKAIILHFMLGYEHPFRDGNGRTARALFYWFMLKHEYDLFKYISISKLLKDDPKGYGLSFIYTEKDQNDLTYFIDFQLDIILSAFEELQKYLQTKTDEFNQVLEMLDDSKFSGKLNFVQKDIIKKGTKEPGRIFTVKEIASSYEIGETSARTYLKKLVELKLILKTMDGRTTLYISPSDLRDRLKDN
ncbi:Fic family protein [Psychrobium sp. 1_MG-2023]|uniref:Fic family protein n=1 Tax=Psychrobium sp. 1_MG-2023 TaxID=3062624 RepID=UPI000C335F24|nr:Fic family protein [Psychrobium sp. 1_MG-2023]MDP2560126.1 Fic family protein [Psychrobium sp. 1_MG-2023]PKF56939.1 Fic family protein [Alteromonadales bacterium alter-6D02]